MAKPQYRGVHQQTREAWRPIVESGQAQCAEPICLMATRWIPPGSPWDLAHDRAAGGYRGPAHARCNRSEGARWLAWLKRQARRPAPPPKSNRWRL